MVATTTRDARFGCSHQVVDRDRLRSKKIGGRSLAGSGPAVRRVSP
jgi:hypothetical protein